MIVDKIENRERYFIFGEGIERALRYLAVTDFSSMAPGKYSIEGDSIFAIVDEYNLRETNSAHLEAHRKYADVQFIADGSEKMGYAPLDGNETIEEYSLDRDIAFYGGDESLVTLSKGMFMILLPGDLHKPGVGSSSEIVRKVVVKVAMNQLKK